MVFVLFTVSALWLTSPPPDGTETLDGSPNRIQGRINYKNNAKELYNLEWNGYLQSLVGFMNNHHQNISAANLGAYLNHVEIDSWCN